MLYQCDYCKKAWKPRGIGAPSRCPSCQRHDYNSRSPFSIALANGKLDGKRRRPGRPIGSTNKPKVVITPDSPPIAAPDRPRKRA